MKHIAAFRMNAFVKYFDKDQFEITVIASSDSSAAKYAEYESARVFYLSGSNLIKIRKQ